MPNYILYYQGDILFLRMGEDPIRAGEIVVFNIDVRFPISFCYPNYLSPLSLFLLISKLLHFFF